MAAVNPQAFFRFASANSGLIAELYQKGRKIPEAEVRALIRRHAKPTDPSPVHVMDQLVELRVLEVSPDATASYDMVRQVATLMGYLLQEFRLTSVEVIQGYLNDLNKTCDELDAARQSGSQLLARRTIEGMTDTIERMRQDSRANRDAIIAEALIIKGNRDEMSVRERFERVNRLWERYLMPLRDMIDVHKELDSTLDGMDVRLDDAQEAFAMDGQVAESVAGCEARLRRLRREISNDFREGLHEITPLYNELWRETMLARGASHALQRIGKEGLAALGLSERMGICFLRTEGLVSSTRLHAYLQGIRGYQPRPPEPVPHGDPDALEDFIDPRDLEQSLAANLPVDDVLAWLLASYPDVPLCQVLRAYGRIHSGALGAVRFRNQEHEYRTPSHVLRACPMAAVGSDA